MRLKFLRENWSSISKLYINQLGVAIFSMFLYTAAGAISENDKASLLIKVGISIFSMLFYYVLIYNVSWEIGAKDKIRIDAGRLEKKPSKGGGIGFFANIPNFTVIGIALIAYIVFAISGIDIFYTIFTLLNIFFRIFVSIYLGVIQGICDPLKENNDLYWIMQTSLYLVFSGISVLMIYISYIFGLNDKRIFPNSKFKSNK